MQLTFWSPKIQIIIQYAMKFKIVYNRKYVYVYIHEKTDKDISLPYAHHLIFFQQIPPFFTCLFMKLELTLQRYFGLFI